MGARAINGFLGLWLFATTFLWPHTPFQNLNGWIVGMLVVVMAMTALSGVRWGRLVNAVLGGWLIVSAILTPMSGRATIWNNIVVGALLAFFALLPSLPAARNRAI